MLVVSLLSVAVRHFSSAKIEDSGSSEHSLLANEQLAAALRDLEIETTPQDCLRGLYGILKRVIDFVGAAVLFILLSPAFAIVALLVRLSSPGPVIFRQTRLTGGGRTFTMYKFRTMYANAESKTGAVWASKNDSRITPVGRILRKTRLDEIPQLVNVLKGEMSIIGPRPERPELACILQSELPSFHKRHQVRAGITGLAQVEHGYAGCTESYRRKLALDLLYVKRCCLLLDLRIALRTIFVIFTGSGSR